MKKISGNPITRLLMIAMGSLLLSARILMGCENGEHRGERQPVLTRAEVSIGAAQNSYTRIAEYKINEQQMTVELVWHFDHNKEVFTKFTGYTQDLSDTRLAAYMFASENTPKIVEVNTANQVVYEATINRARLLITGHLSLMSTVE